MCRCKPTIFSLSLSEGGGPGDAKSLETAENVDGSDCRSVQVRVSGFDPVSEEHQTHLRTSVIPIWIFYPQYEWRTSCLVIYYFLLLGLFYIRGQRLSVMISKTQLKSSLKREIIRKFCFTSRVWVTLPYITRLQKSGLECAVTGK